MNLKDYKQTVLPNGLTVVTAPMPAVRSVSIGLYLRVGSRYEAARFSGISHFLEHMLFKGCEGWPSALDIANEVEGRGGYLNASTGYEYTSMWVKIGARHWQRSLGLLASMVQRPIFDVEEFEREQTVILDEINMYRDVPEDYVSQLSSEAMWGDHPLGREIAGETETVAALTMADLAAHHAAAYRPNRAVLTVAGAIDGDAVYNVAAEAFAGWTADGPIPAFAPAPSLEARPRWRLQVRDSEQSHLQLAVPGLPRLHPDRVALAVLNALAGDGMSSWLWQRLREQLGLAYNIGSYTSLHADCGVLGVYGGCDAARLFETLDETMAVWQELQAEAVAEDKLQLFKEYLKGRLELSSEDSSAVASWWGRQIVTDMPLQSLDQVLANIDAVTPADVQRLAQDLWQPQRLTLAYVGPLDDEAALTDWLRAL